MDDLPLKEGRAPPPVHQIKKRIGKSPDALKWGQAGRATPGGIFKTLSGESNVPFAS